MNAIGGYFELELRNGNHYHKDAIRLNTARNCFEYILRAKRYKKVYLPYFTCEVMLEPLRKLNVDCEFYHIDINLEPTAVFPLKADEAFLYTNYFGMKQSCVERLSGIYGKQLIVDNSQAFFAEPIDGIYTFYSPRKFVGVADSGYLYTDKRLDVELEQDLSYERMSHLLKRIDLSAEEGYHDFRNNDNALRNQPIRQMSRLTEKLLGSFDYEMIRNKRIANYRLLAKNLDETNRLCLNISDDDVPMVYPYLCTDNDLRKRLISHKVFVATYWPNVFEWCSEEMIEYGLAQKIVPLPIDQRLCQEDMGRIVSLIIGC